MDYENDELAVAVEHYREVSKEIRFYLKEQTRCLVYAGVVLALYFGFGTTKPDSQFATVMQEYGPYVFVLLAVYFLSVSYLRVSHSQYRRYLEQYMRSRIDADIAGQETFLTPIAHEGGFLSVGSRWYQSIPTPMLLLGLLSAGILLGLFTDPALIKRVFSATHLLLAVGVISVYVFIVYPRILNSRFDEYHELHPGDQDAQ